MFHMLAYSGTSTTAAPNTDEPAVVDPIFSRRNNHYIFSEQYQLLAAFHHGVTPTACRLNCPTMNVLGRHQIWPLEASATIPDLPQIADYRDYPINIPVREEVAVETSCSAAGPEQNETFLWVAPMGWNRNLPRGQQRITVAATGAVAGVAASWSAAGALTFTENLRGGYYSLVGAQCFDAGTLAIRFLFPHGAPVNNRQLRPGILCQEAIGNSPLRDNMGGFGVLGAFDTDEPPQIEIFANATAASAQVIRLDLVFHGNSPPTSYAN